MKNDVKNVLYSESVIKSKVEELAKRISEDYADKELLLIGVLKGANVFMCDLMREITFPIQIDFIAASSYGHSTESSGVVKIIKDF